MNWLEFSLRPFPDIFTGGKGAFKIKDALMRKPFTADQLKTTYRYLADPALTVPGGFVGHMTYGGSVNSVSPVQTATAQRDAIMGTACTAGWGDAADEQAGLDWARACYAEIFKDAGGVPAPNEQTAGSVINHPDADFADPVFNKSGLPWHVLYYQHNYPRLQQVKLICDPENIFQHALSVQILSFFCHQVMVITALDDHAMLQYDDLIGIPDS